MQKFKKAFYLIKKIDKKIAVKALACATVLAITFTFCDFSAKCDSIRENVLRLHILANSDSENDQALKLKVRDAVLNVSDEVFFGCNNEADAVKAAEKMSGFITEVAQNEVYKNGYSYEVRVEIADTWFERRTYDDFTLPAGNYEALRIIIAEGKGHNWWCVMFPAVCIPAVTERNQISDVLTNDETEIVSKPQKYVARFKVVEFFQKTSRKLFSFFN